MPTLPSLARLYPAGILPRDRRANDFIPWESLSREKREQLWDANINEETWPYVKSSDRLKILRASKVIESEPEAFLPSTPDTTWTERYNQWLPTVWYDRSVTFDVASYHLVQAIRRGDDWVVGDSLRRDTLLVRVDPAYKTRPTPGFSPRLKQRRYLRKGERDRTVRVATLYEWARQLDLSVEALLDGADWAGAASPRDEVDERRRRRRIRNMLFTGKFGWRRLWFLWKMRNLAIYWNSLVYRPDRLDMAADLREAMEGMEGAVGSRFKIN